MKRLPLVAAALLTACGTPLTRENAAATDDWTLCVIRGQEDRTGEEHPIADGELARRGVNCRELALMRAAVMPRYQAPVLQHYPMQVPPPPVQAPSLPPGIVGTLQSQASTQSVTGVPLWRCRYLVQGSVRDLPRAQSEGPCPPTATFY